MVICRRSAGPLGEGDCWLAAENFMLAAAAEGLGTCCIGLAQAVLNTAEAKRELGIPEDGAAIVAIIVGVPGETPERSPRKPPQILSWLA
jgi:nitroreductase